MESIEAQVPSTCSYNSLGSSNDDVAGFGKYYKLGLRKVGKHLKGPTLIGYASWKKKHSIGLVIEIYHRVDIETNPWLLYMIVFYKGFLNADLQLPFTPLDVLSSTIKSVLPNNL